MPFTEFLDESLVQYLLGDTAYTVPATLYVGLSSTTPTQNSGSAAPYWNVTEPTAGGYARVAVTNGTASWSVNGTLSTATNTGGWTMQNAVAVTFPASTASWGAALTNFFVADGSGALTPGTVNVLLYGALVPNQSVTAAGTTLSFAPGDLLVSLD